MTERRIDTNNAVVVVAVTFFSSAVVETGVERGAGTRMYVAKNREQKRLLRDLLTRMTRRRIDTDNAVVVVTVMFFFSAVAETGAGVEAGTRMFVAKNNSLTIITGQRFVGKNDGTTNQYQ